MPSETRLFSSRRLLQSGPAGRHAGAGWPVRAAVAVAAGKRQPPSRPLPPRHRRMLRLAVPAALAAALALGDGGIATMSANAATTGLTATFQMVSSWGSGYSGQYTLTNHGSAVTNWTLSFKLPSGTSITSMWNGFYKTSGGKVSVTPVFWSGQSWDGTIAAGQSLQVGFVTEASGTAAGPSGCLVDGASCKSGQSASAARPEVTTTAGGR
jgi:hypothetical protein